MDTASALALLQEAELSKVKGKTQFKEGYKNAFKAQGDKLKAVELEKAKPQAMGPEQVDKLTTLKNFRCRNGLCFRCGNKWSKEHKCPPQVPLHVIEDLLDALEPMGLDDYQPDCEALEETVMTMDVDPAATQLARKTMKLCGQIEGKRVLILVDSGSVSSFVSTQLADSLKLHSTLCREAKFTTADGNTMVCNRQIKNLKWKVQGSQFHDYCRHFAS